MATWWSTIFVIHRQGAEEEETSALPLPPSLSQPVVLSLEGAWSLEHQPRGSSISRLAMLLAGEGFPLAAHCKGHVGVRGKAGTVVVLNLLPVAPTLNPRDLLWPDPAGIVAQEMAAGNPGLPPLLLDSLQPDSAGGRGCRDTVAAAEFAALEDIDPEGEL